MQQQVTALLFDREIATEPLTRTTPEIAEELYMDGEKTNAVLRAELDAIRMRVDEQAAELLRIHNHQNDARRTLADEVNDIQLTLVELVGRDKRSGLVYSHKSQLKKIFSMIDELKSKYGRILIYLSGAAGAGGAIGKFFF